jgi:hypothetical protein
MDPLEMKMFMEMYGYPFGFSLSPFVFPRYLPSAIGPMSMNPAKLKEKMIKEDPAFSAKLHDFSKMYRIHAASLFDTNSNMFPPSHLGGPRGTNNHVVQEENEQLRKENAELKKRIEQLTKNKKHL